MRRYKKKELLETADMLVEANEVIGRLCKSNIDGALELLGQCQESAILLGNLIESKGDGYAELVEILENYCENIYQMSIAVSDEEQIRKLSKKIQRQLTYLNNKIRHEIPEDKKATRENQFENVDVLKLRNELIRQINQDVLSHVE